MPNNKNYKKKYVIFSPAFDQNSGGIVCLHKLCHHINNLGHEAYLLSYFNTYLINHLIAPNILFRLIFNYLKYYLTPYKLHKDWKCKKISLNQFKEIDPDDVIVVYPEITLGNPLNAKHIVRWLLHNPGYHSKKIFYGPNELYFRFNSAIKYFTYLNSKCSSDFLKIVSYPIDMYINKSKNIKKTDKIAYCIRKGKNKKIIHDLTNSILIDDLSHDEVANVFAQCSIFISYDTYTAYSLFAAISGCISVVIPDDNISIEEWYPDPSDRLGIAYGMSEEQINHSINTREYVLERLKEEEALSELDSKRFIIQTQNYFKNEKYSIQ